MKVPVRLANHVSVSVPVNQYQCHSGRPAGNLEATLVWIPASWEKIPSGQESGTELLPDVLVAFDRQLASQSGKDWLWQYLWWRWWWFNVIEGKRTNWPEGKSVLHGRQLGQSVKKGHSSSSRWTLFIRVLTILDNACYRGQKRNNQTIPIRMYISDKMRKSRKNCHVY